MTISLPIFTQDGDIDTIQAIIDKHKLPIDLINQPLPKFNQKYLLSALQSYQTCQALMIDKHKLVLISYQNNEIVKVSNDWESLTQRVVNAGRKSELLLQACKLTKEMTLIDGTAGFGHDSLILASTGAKVIMLENNAIMALMLLAEYQRMSSHKNWQGLLSRLMICPMSFLACTLDELKVDNIEMIYLDPMFPKDSYTAKVGKNMQVLHEFVAIPNSDDECDLFNHAKTLLNQDGKLIIKRPIGASYLANQTPTQSWQNDALRFDGYW